MLEFKNLVYLDLQKTGTTSIVQFLRNVTKETEVPHGGHTIPEAGHDTSKFHFISIRNPLGIYVSLFGHGVARRGGLYNWLRRSGRATDLYEPSLAGFSKWLEFMLDPENAQVIGKKYAKLNVKDVCGPLTKRLLLLSVVDPFAALNAADIKDYESLLAFFQKSRIYDRYVRTEHLVGDLYSLWGPILENSKIKRKFRGIGSLEEFKAVMPSKNVGAKVEGVTVDAIPQELKARVREQEALFYDVFGYDDAPKGNPSPLPAR